MRKNEKLAIQYFILSLVLFCSSATSNSIFKNNTINNSNSADYQNCASREIFILPKDNVHTSQLANTLIQNLMDSGALNNVKHVKERGAEISIQEEHEMHSFERMLKAEVAPQENLELIIDQLNDSQDVSFAEPDCKTYLPTSMPSDQFANSANLWGHFSLGVDVEDAWLQNFKGQNVLVGVLDEGTNFNHTDLAANLGQNSAEIANNGIDDDGNGFVDDIHGWDFVSNDNSALPISSNESHGSHVTGTISSVGNNSGGMVGVAFEAKYIPVRVLGPGGGSLSSLVSGIEYAADLGLPIINMSLGGPSSSAICTAVSYAHSRGVLVVVAAGNSNTNISSTSPANCQNSFTVAAHTSSQNKASFSNFGNGINVSAPGVDILSTVVTGYSEFNGTSMASPHVAGVAALVAGANPGLTHENIAQIIEESAQDAGSPGYDTIFGHGKAKASAAVDLATSDAWTLPTMDISQLTFNVDVGDTVNFEITTSSPNNLDVTITHSNLPAGANFNSNSGEFNWLVGSQAAGQQFTINFTAETLTGSVNQDVVINVSGTPVIDGSNPVVSPIEYNSFIQSKACQNSSNDSSLITLMLALLIVAFERKRKLSTNQ